MDLATYRELYYRWEHEQWAAGEIDLAADHDHWRGNLSDELKRSLLWQLSCFYVADERATAALVPYIDAAPTEEQQVFLSSQLVDTARHLVFFDRFLSDVVGEDGDMTGRLEKQPRLLNDQARTLLLELLPSAAANIRGGSGDVSALVEGVVLQHLVIEGSLASAARHYLSGFLAESGLLPGLQEGLAAIERDGRRHLDFAVRFLKDSVDNDGRLADVVRTALTDNPIGWSALQPPGGDQSFFDPFPFSPDDVTDAAKAALDDSLRVIGVDLAA